MFVGVGLSQRYSIYSNTRENAMIICMTRSPLNAQSQAKVIQSQKESILVRKSLRGTNIVRFQSLRSDEEIQSIALNSARQSMSGALLD